MTGSVFVRRGGSVGVAVILMGTAAVDARPSSVVDARGFEAPLNTTTAFGTGRLQGQSALVGTGGGTQSWVASPFSPTGSARVQGGVVKTGSQAVSIDRAANEDARWAVPVSGIPGPGNRFVVIDWDQRTEQTVSSAFGPYFAVEAYDDSGAALGQIGSLGVDASTGDVLFQQEGTGFLVETNQDVAFGQWHGFRLVIDFQAERYYGFFENQPVSNTGFIDAGLTRFTDADLAAIAAGGDPASQSLTGTAYVDNFIVLQTDNAGVLANAPGDYNASGQVEQGDLDLVLQNWGVDVTAFGVGGGGAGGIPAGWLNDLPEGVIDQAELDRVLQNWGSLAAPNFHGLAVPEPGTTATAMACGALALRRRRC